MSFMKQIEYEIHKRERGGEMNKYSSFHINEWTLNVHVMKYEI